MQSKINFLVDAQEFLVATVKGLKLAWFVQVINYDSLSKTILEGALEGG